LFEHKYSFDTFDQNTAENKGRSRVFNLDVYLQAVDMMINSEEIAFAFKMLNQLPGWYRDNEPKEVTEMRKALYRQLYTNKDYAKNTSYKFLNGAQEFDLAWPRSHAILEIVQGYNNAQIKPHIFDLGAGNFYLPLGLKERGCDFTYKSVDLSDDRLDEIKQKVDWQENATSPTIFVACEIIEHLWNPEDLTHYAAQLESEPEWIILSTPKYNFAGSMPNWETRELGHIKTFTPKDFNMEAQRLFPKYDFKYCEGHVMVLIGSKK